MTSDVVRLAQDLVRIPSPSGEEGEVAEFLRSALGEFAEVEAGPCGAVVAQIARGPGPVVMLCGHMDTVPAGDESAWEEPPFGAKVVDGVLFGRGVVDMKGAIAAQLTAAASVAREVQGTLFLVYVPHEEIAEGVVLAKVLDRWAKPDVVVLGEPTDLRLGIGHRGRVVIRLEARGKAAHAAMPELGENAIEKLVEAMPFAWAAPPVEDPVLGRGSVTPVALATDFAGPVVPSRCWALLDRRIGRGETPQSVLVEYEGLGVEAKVEAEEIRLYTGEKLQVRFFFPAWWMDPEHPWVARAWEALGTPPLRVWRFSTDGVESCGRRGLPTVGFGPGDETLAHQANERLATADLVKAVEGYKRLLRGLFRGEPERSPQVVPERRGRVRRRR